MDDEERIPEVTEEDQEMQDESSPLIDMKESVDVIDQTFMEEERYLNEHPEERVFKELLNEAKQ